MIYQNFLKYSHSYYALSGYAICKRSFFNDLLSYQNFNLTFQRIFKRMMMSYCIKDFVNLKGHFCSKWINLIKFLIKMKVWVMLGSKRQERYFMIQYRWWLLSHRLLISILNSWDKKLLWIYYRNPMQLLKIQKFVHMYLYSKRLLSFHF